MITSEEDTVGNLELELELLVRRFEVLVSEVEDSSELNLLSHSAQGTVMTVVCTTVEVEGMLELGTVKLPDGTDVRGVAKMDEIGVLAGRDEGIMVVTGAVLGIVKLVDTEGSCCAEDVGEATNVDGEGEGR